MEYNQNRLARDDRNDELLKQRISNVNETQKRIHRLFGLIYLLFFLIMLTWYNTNFESSPLERNIQRFHQALKIEMLRPLDDFLKRTASCFHSYFFGYGKHGIVTHDDLKEYIKYYESENRRIESFIRYGLERPWPVRKMKELIQSEDHWNDCAFWAKQDTLVSFLFSLHYYLQHYFLSRLQAQYDGKIEQFWTATDSINIVVDSALGSLATRIDSLGKPFERSVKIGWNPFVSDLTVRASLWGEHWSFDEYSKFDLNNLLCVLQKLNHVAWFKSEINRYKPLLFRVHGDLETILKQKIILDNIVFSHEKTDIDFHRLSIILNSPLLTDPDLPDSIQLPQLCNLTYTTSTLTPISDELLKAYFPGYIRIIEEFNIDKVGGVKTLKNILVSQRGTVKQKIQLLGGEISSRSILYFLPFACFCFYLLALWLMRHLGVLLRSDQERAIPQALAPSLRIELLKAPYFITLRPLWVNLIVIAIPALWIILILFDQMLTAGGRGIALNPLIVWFLTVGYISVGFFIRREAISLQQLAEGSVPDSCDSREENSPPDT